MSHSILPWKTNNNSMIKTDKNQDIISCFNVSSSDENRNVDGKANAAFIVKAVNNHENLLEALKGLINAPPFIDNGTDMTESLQAKINASVAIKEAE